MPATDPYVSPFICHRCRMVLTGTGGVVVDPLPSEAQRLAWAANAPRLVAMAAERRQQAVPLGNLPQRGGFEAQAADTLPPAAWAPSSPVAPTVAAPEPEVELAELDAEPPRRVACRPHRPVWRLICPDCNADAPRPADLDPRSREWRALRAKVIQPARGFGRGESGEQVMSTPQSSSSIPQPADQQLAAAAQRAAEVADAALAAMQPDSALAAVQLAAARINAGQEAN